MSRRPASADFSRDAYILAMLAGGRYFVSEDSTVFDRESGRYRIPTPDADGHPVLNLSDCGAVRVSRLVALQHFGLPPDGQYQVGHKNGNISDNRAVNLCWASPKETSAAAHAAGKVKHPVGKSLPRTKLTEAQVAEVRRLIAGGFSMREIARSLDVSKGAIDGIKYGKSWRHL